MKYADETWKTKDGTLIKVSDMTETHAKNALRLMLRQRKKWEDEGEEFMDDMMEEAFGWDDEFYK